MRMFIVALLCALSYAQTGGVLSCADCVNSISSISENTASTLTCDVDFTGCYEQGTAMQSGCFGTFNQTRGGVITDFAVDPSNGMACFGSNTLSINTCGEGNDVWQFRQDELGIDVVDPASGQLLRTMWICREFAEGDLNVHPSCEAAQPESCGEDCPDPTDCAHLEELVAEGGCGYNCTDCMKNAYSDFLGCSGNINSETGIDEGNITSISSEQTPVCDPVFLAARFPDLTSDCAGVLLESMQQENSGNSLSEGECQCLLSIDISDEDAKASLECTYNVNESTTLLTLRSQCLTQIPAPNCTISDDCVDYEFCWGGICRSTLDPSECMALECHQTDDGWKWSETYLYDDSSFQCTNRPECHEGFEWIGSGWCRPSGCTDLNELTCRVNGIWKDDSNAEECYSTCVDNAGICTGYATSHPDHADAPNRCYVYGDFRQADVPAGWYFSPQTNTDIATSRDHVHESDNVDCYKLISEGGHCIGELESLNSRCIGLGKTECEAEGVSYFSDGVCDWVPDELVDTCSSSDIEPLTSDCQCGSERCSYDKYCWSDLRCQKYPKNQAGLNPKYPDDFIFSHGEQPSGYRCLEIIEDSPGWGTNYFCWSDTFNSPNFWYTRSGEVPSSRARCTLLENPANEKWSDNYLCVLNEMPYEFEWSCRGPTDAPCMHWDDPDNSIYDDCYLCLVSEYPCPRNFPFSHSSNPAICVGDDSYREVSVQAMTDCQKWCTLDVEIFDGCEDCCWSNFDMACTETLQLRLEVIHLDGVFTDIQTRIEEFLALCSAQFVTISVECIDAQPGSIILTLKGPSPNVAMAADDIRSNGLALEGFDYYESVPFETCSFTEPSSGFFEGDSIEVWQAHYGSPDFCNSLCCNLTECIGYVWNETHCDLKNSVRTYQEHGGFQTSIRSSKNSEELVYMTSFELRFPGTACSSSTEMLQFALQKELDEFYNIQCIGRYIASSCTNLDRRSLSAAYPVYVFDVTDLSASELSDLVQRLSNQTLTQELEYHLVETIPELGDDPQLVVTVKEGSVKSTTTSAEPNNATSGESSNMLTVVLIIIAAIFVLFGLCALFFKIMIYDAVHKDANKEFERDIEMMSSTRSPNDCKSTFIIPPVEDRNNTWSIPGRELKREDISFSTKAKIASGAFGAIYKGRWASADVAIKTCSKETLASMLQEIHIIMKIPIHPHVVHTYGYCSDGEFNCIVMQYVKGSSLHDLKSKPALTREQYLGIFTHAASGIAHLHAQSPRMIHRDIACRNIMVNNDFSEAVIIDFGMAREVLDAGKTEANIGPIRWMAPEAIENNVYSTKTDVWSFGVMCVEAIKRKIPYENLSNHQVVLKVAGKTLHPEIPSHWSVTFGPDFVSLLLSCWDFDPGNRPEMAQIQQSLYKMTHGRKSDLYSSVFLPKQPSTSTMYQSCDDPKHGIKHLMQKDWDMAASPKQSSSLLQSSVSVSVRTPSELQPTVGRQFTYDGILQRTMTATDTENDLQKGATFSEMYENEMPSLSTVQMRTQDTYDGYGVQTPSIGGSPGVCDPNTPAATKQNTFENYGGRPPDTSDENSLHSENPRQPSVMNGSNTYETEPGSRTSEWNPGGDRLPASTESSPAFSTPSFIVKSSGELPNQTMVSAKDVDITKDPDDYVDTQTIPSPSNHREGSADFRGLFDSIQSAQEPSLASKTVDKMQEKAREIGAAGKEKAILAKEHAEGFLQAIKRLPGRRNDISDDDGLELKHNITSV